MVTTLCLLLSFGNPTSDKTRITNLIGRFERIDNGWACEWPGSAIQFTAQGSSAKVSLKASSENDRWQVDIDGRATEVLKLDPKKDSYTIKLPDGKKHIVTLVRRTECFSGKTIFFGLENNGLEAPPRSARKIEIIGDSISAGFGVDGKKKEDPYSYDTANAYMTYGWIAARQLRAECTIVAWSGRKMYPDNTVPEIFDFVLPAEKQGKVADDPKTQAVLINLATNDFGKAPPDKTKWCGTYAGFIKKLRGKFPQAHIYLATGSMMSDNWPPNTKSLSTLKEYLASIVAFVHDPKVHRIDFAIQDEKDGIGSSWHPNKVTQTKMGNHFAATLKKDLGW